MNALLVAGTDTGVGKTVLITALIAYWQHYSPSRPAGAIKLVNCGGDRNHYPLLALNQSPEEITPVQFQSSSVPPIAAHLEGRSVELEKIWHSFDILRQQRDCVFAESFGGLGSPLTPETTMADLAWDWRLPTILVVPVQPGAIAHAVANVALAHHSRIHLKGIVLNCSQPCNPQALEQWASPTLIQSLTQKPILGCIPYLADLGDRSKLIQIASELDLERILPSLPSYV